MFPGVPTRHQISERTNVSGKKSSICFIQGAFFIPQGGYIQILCWRCVLPMQDVQMTDTLQTIPARSPLERESDFHTPWPVRPYDREAAVIPPCIMMWERVSQKEKGQVEFTDVSSGPRLVHNRTDYHINIFSIYNCPIDRSMTKYNKARKLQYVINQS